MTMQAKLDIMELRDLEPDGEVVMNNGEIVTAKCAIYYAWNLPFLAGRLELTETELRQCLHRYSDDWKGSALPADPELIHVHYALNIYKIIKKVNCWKHRIFF